LKIIYLFVARHLTTCASCIFLLTFGIIPYRYRVYIYQICKNIKNRANPTAIKGIIPKTSYSNELYKNHSVCIYDPLHSDDAIIILNQLIKEYNPSRIFEIGTSEGRGTLNMAENSSKEALLFTLDFSRDNKIGRKYRHLNTKYPGKITQLYGESRTFDFSLYNNSIDFIFVDAGHTYEVVMNDTIKALELLRNRKGIIVWHDYLDLDGVTMALNELYQTNKTFENIKHIDGTYLAYLILN